MKPVSLTEKPYWQSGLFLSVLFLKLAASFFFASSYLKELFIPFINWFVLNQFQNPWEFFAGQGMWRMFPYPALMLWIMSVPRLLLSPLLAGDWQAVTPLHYFAARIPLFISDMILFASLIRLLPAQQKKILTIYWCSPIVFFVNYIHGQLDIIPTALFTVSLLLLVYQRYLPFAVMLALAAATKNHILIAVPFLWVFLYKKKISWAKMFLYFFTFAGIYGFFLLPYGNSEAFKQMVFHSPEQRKIFDFVIPVSENLKLIVCPTVLALLFIKFASYKKLNREILLMFLGIAFAALVVFVPPMPGWFLWSFPFLVYFYTHNKDYSRAPFILYNAIYIVYFLFFFEKQGDWVDQIQANLPIRDLALSIVMSSVGFIAFWMFHLGVGKNEELKAAESPLLIGIGGDSGTGKHTLLRVLRSVVGKSRSIPIFGDDFHKWERGNQNWNVYTHLNPSANRLHEGANLAVALRDGHSIQMVHYDHKTGKFTDPQTVEPSKFIFFVGLHPFYLKKMRELISLKIYLDTDESLRQYWKIRRDVERRGHSREKVMQQIFSRQEDKNKFIEPQREFADLVIRYSSAVPIDLQKTLEENLPVRTSFVLDNSINLEDLSMLLSKILTLEVTHTTDVHLQELSVSGSVTAREIRNIALQLNLNFDELFINPRGWVSNDKGVTQLVFLLLYNHKMKAR